MSVSSASMSIVDRSSNVACVRPTDDLRPENAPSGPNGSEPCRGRLLGVETEVIESTARSEPDASDGGGFEPSVALLAVTSELTLMLTGVSPAWLMIDTSSRLRRASGSDDGTSAAGLIGRPASRSGSAQPASRSLARTTLPIC